MVLKFHVLLGHHTKLTHTKCCDKICHIVRVMGKNECARHYNAARNAGISKDFIFFVILEYYLINYVKFSAIYVLTTSPLASDNRVLVR